MEYSKTFVCKVKTINTACIMLDIDKCKVNLIAFINNKIWDYMLHFSTIAKQCNLKIQDQFGVLSQQNTKQKYTKIYQNWNKIGVCM